MDAPAAAPVAATQVPTPHLRYVDEFVGSLECAPKLLELRLLPNAKELTETVAAFHAIRTHLPSFSLTDPTIALVAVGDGATPRLAALAAFLTRWTCHSVDPLLPTTNRWTAVDRLHTYAGKIEEFKFAAPRCVVVLMHAHVPLPKALESIASASIGIIVCPCCDFYDKHKLARAPDVEYDDWGILSPHRLMRVWRPSGEPPIAPLSALEISPVQVHTDTANRLAVPVADAAWLLKHDLVAYFEQARAAGLREPMALLRLAARLAPPLGRSLAALPPPQWLADIAARPMLHAERRELLRQVLITGKAPAELAPPPPITQTPADSVEARRNALLQELRQVVAQRPGLAEELRAGPPRPQIVNFLLGALIKSGGRTVPPEELRARIVLPFCENFRGRCEAEADGGAARRESGAKRDRDD